MRDPVDFRQQQGGDENHCPIEPVQFCNILMMMQLEPTQFGSWVSHLYVPIAKPSIGDNRSTLPGRMIRCCFLPKRKWSQLTKTPPSGRNATNLSSLQSSGSYTLKWHMHPAVSRRGQLDSSSIDVVNQHSVRLATIVAMKQLQFGRPLGTRQPIGVWFQRQMYIGVDDAGYT